MNPSLIHMTRILNLFFTDRINPDSGGTLASGRQLSETDSLSDREPGMWLSMSGSQ